ncbi:MAG: hypothetical protein JXQ73_13740 [Phycisphaerae bacterium]|nr:hypothetical protein [Phycisphaerae bacterium]
MCDRSLLAGLTMLAAFSGPWAMGEGGGTRSETARSVLWKALPPEDVRCEVGPEGITIQGPTYTYVVDGGTGAIRSLEVRRGDRVVIGFDAPADVVLDDFSLASRLNVGKTDVVSRSGEKVVLGTEGRLKTRAGEVELPYRLTSTFFNDGVVVCELTLRPERDLPIRRGIKYRLDARGPFRRFYHREVDRNGLGEPHGALPGVGKAVGFKTLTSCLQVFSATAGVAAFTDSGGLHVEGGALDTAVIEVKRLAGDQTSTTLTQYIARVGAEGKPYVLKGGVESRYRVGMAIAPNRLPHARRRDLRMFIWVGDAKHPYPTDKEIEEVAHLGYTLFQMHRVGTPGEPRPPAGELERVIETVHRHGMLFLWTANADLMYASAKGVADLVAAGKWPLWKGFNYGGKYKARMDPYCDLMATCLASPNGLADYRVQCLERMMDRYQVDGMYIDDNLAYGNCTLAKEHGHPRTPYDSLIELHEMNWKRRQVLRRRCPHAVLVDHCSTGLALPVICDFDVHLYGEGYGFSSLEAYWDLFGSIDNMYAQGSMYPGDTEGSRCAARIAYNYDLLTGGGQYCYLDWRLYPKKFPYAKGVAKDETLFIRTYSLPQVYFGMYESEPFIFAQSADVFATTTPKTYATVYANRIWKDYLVPIANMQAKDQETSVRIQRPERLGVSPDADYVLYDVNERTVSAMRGADLGKGLSKILVPAQGLRLLYIRELPAPVPYHLWGGKRISEVWDADGRRLTFEVHGPVGLRDTVFVGTGDVGVREVKVGGKPSDFFFDVSKRVAHGPVRFGAEPVRVEVRCSEDRAGKLPERAIGPDELAVERGGKR